MLSPDGATMIVGAPSEASAATGIDGDRDDNSAASAGAAYVFTRSGTTWFEQSFVKASNTDSLDWFGMSFALSADLSTLVVGAYGEASSATGVDGNQIDDTMQNAGAAYVFER